MKMRLVWVLALAVAVSVTSSACDDEPPSDTPAALPDIGDTDDADITVGTDAASDGSADATITPDVSLDALPDTPPDGTTDTVSDAVTDGSAGDTNATDAVTDGSAGDTNTTDAVGDALAPLPPAVSVEPAPQGGVFATTAHYRLWTDADAADAAQWAQMLEASWDDFETFFGGATPPPGLLAVDVYSNPADFQANVVYPDGSPVMAGGYYDPQTQIASCYLQPSPYYTRSLILHEAAHQYHWLARLDNAGGTPDWYDEGIASYLQHHHWDGVEATLGVVPLATLEDYPLQGWLDLEATTDLAAVIDSSTSFSYELARLVVAYLHENVTEGFTSFRAELDAGAGSALELFQSHLGTPESVKQDTLAWAPTAQEPFEIIYIQWTHVDPARIFAEAGPGVISYILAKAAPVTLQTSLELPAIEEKAGFVFGYVDGSNYAMALVDASGTFEVVQVSDGQWAWLDTVALPPASSVTLEVAGTTLTVNGVDYGSYGVGAGRAGLLSWGSHVMFEQVFVEP